MSLNGRSSLLLRSLYRRDFFCGQNIELICQSVDFCFLLGGIGCWVCDLSFGDAASQIDVKQIGSFTLKVAHMI